MASSCPCGARARRRCELCPDEPSLACSLRCLQHHQHRRHPNQADTSTAGRAQDYQRQVNRLGQRPEVWQWYAGHRQRLTQLCIAVQRGEGLCVLGAGNCNDLDLPGLVRAFGEVHLVDVDGAALASALERVPPGLRRRVHLHAPVDLTGCLEQIDAWGDALPDAATLRAWAPRAAGALAQAIGGRFDVVLSACALSQLCHPFQNAWALQGDEWRRLFDAVTRVHLETIVCLTRAGGTGVLACDVLSYAGPALASLVSEVPRPQLTEALVAAVEHGQLLVSPDPRALAAALETQMADAVERLHITQPWLWDLGTTVQLVYGVLFRRIADEGVPSRFVPGSRAPLR